MLNTILITSIILTVFVFVETYRTCPEEQLFNCLHSSSIIVEDFNDCIWIIRVLLETFF